MNRIWRALVVLLAPLTAAGSAAPDSETSSVSQLAEPLTMSLSAVVQHLNVLEASGLVSTDKLGRVRTCRIEPKALRAAERWINERRLAWERRPDRLGDILAETAETKDES